MKVRLETYFRLGEEATYPKGTCFEGSLGELPNWVQDLVNEKNKDITILQNHSEPPEDDSEPPEVEEPPEADKPVLLKRSNK